ncbi:MAG: molybdopterin molybdenumtransferase MoeA [Alteromonadaceae bacterium]|nr:MAG: molybdopterin molybdenumtransferase MoeA [Alteromonadaceae bacterium]
MLSIDQARQNIIEAVRGLSETQTLNLDHALGRVLAQDITATINVPPADNSAMDGYVFRLRDVTPNADGKYQLSVSQTIAAGYAPSDLKAGTAARILTGAEIPANADTVIIQENCNYDAENSTICFDTLPQLAQNVRPCGQDIAVGSVVLPKQRRLKPQDIGLIASIGQNEIEVYRPLRVALLNTGDELADPGTPLKPGQIYNSNQALLSALLTKLNCELISLPTVADTLEDTVAALKSASEQADLILSTGGVSVGDEDHVKAAVTSLGALDLWKINMKPGKPLAFGQVCDTPFLGLPGNPVSAMVTFLMFAAPLIQTMQGQEASKPFSLPMPICFSIDKARARPELLRVRMTDKGVERFGNQSSGVLSSLSWANALAFVPDGVTLAVGDSVSVYPLDLLA